MKIGRMAAWTLAALLAANGAAAQEVVIRGQVLDSETRQPVRGALVVATDVNQGALTDSLGLFGIVLPKLETYRLRITQMGYAQMDLEMPPEAESRPFTVVMPPDPVVLEGLDVVLDALADRRRGPYGVADVLTQTDLQASAEGTSFELVRRLIPFAQPCRNTPGQGETEALCLSGVAATGGQRFLRVCIDDRLVQPEIMETLLSTVDPRALYMAESYSRAGEVRLYTPAYMQRLIEMGSDIPPLTFGCTGPTGG